MNKTFDNEYYRNRYKEKREQILNNQKIWRERNPEKVRAIKKRYYVKKFDSPNNFLYLK